LLIFKGQLYFTGMESIFKDGKFRYRFDADSGILEAELPAKIDIMSVRAHYETLENLDQRPENLKVLLLAGDTEFHFKENALPLFSVAAEAVVDKYKSVKEAIVVSRPNETIVATLFSEISIINFEFRVFHSDSDAREWLLS